MLKVIGAALLLLGCTGIGISVIRRLDQRANTLRSLIEALGLIERELVFYMPPMRDLLLVTAQRASQPSADFLRECVKGIDTYEASPFSEAWKKAAAKTLSGLKEHDLQILNSVGSVLGRFDVDGQRKAIEESCEQLNVHLSESVEERNRQGKVYGTLSITAGAFLVILLI